MAQIPLPDSLLKFKVDLNAMEFEIVSRMKRATEFAKRERVRLAELKKDLPAFFESTDINTFLMTLVVMDRMQLGIDWLEVIRIAKYAKPAYHCFYDQNARMKEANVREFFGGRDDLVDEFSAFLNRGYNAQHNPGGAFDFGDKSEFAFLPTPMFNLICARFRMNHVVRKILESDAPEQNKLMVFENHVDRWLCPKYASYAEKIVEFVRPRVAPGYLEMIKDAFVRAIV